jgi:Tfp pilus assembly protein PilX
MGIKHLREDEKGSGLVLTLMVLLVLSVLGVSIGTLTLGSYRLSDANRDDTSAYYVAEAGAVAAYEEIQSQVLGAYESDATEGSFYDHVSTIVTSKNGQSAVDFGEQFGSEPTAKITTAQKDSKTYTLTSTGEVDGKQRTVTKQFTVTWVEKNTVGGSGLPILPAKGALLSNGDIKIADGVTIDGNIYAYGDVNIPNGNINGNIYANGGVSITDGMLNGDVYTNSTKKNAFTIDGWINLRSSTVFHSNQITAEELLKYPKNYTNFPRLEAKDNVWDSTSYLPDFQTYQSLVGNITVPTNTVSDFNKMPDETIKNDEWNSYKVQDNGNLFLNNWMLETYNLEVTDNIAFNKIIVGSGKTLTIDTMGGNHTISVEDLSIDSGTLNIVGGGAVTLVVNNLRLSSSNLNIVGDSAVTFLVNDLQMTSSSFTISKEGIATMVVDGKMTFGHDLYINKTGTSDQLLFIYTGPTPNFNSITSMNAHVIVLGNKGPVNIIGSSINGVFLTDNKNVSIEEYGSSNMMLIAPDAKASLSGGASLNGSVITDKFDMTDGASLKYAVVNTTGFPFGSTAPVADPDPEDIISSEPIIEN